jgi:pilus assembly protein Flp/PilA
MVRSILRKWFADEEAATASEYAFMLVLIICAVIASVSAVGNSVANGWSNNVSQVTSACNGS